MSLWGRSGNNAALAFTYDQANRLLKVSNSYRGSANPPLNPVTSFSYVLDAVGNRLQITDGSGKATSYGYDPLYELTSVTSGTNVTTFSYDPVGNRLSLTAPGTSIAYAYDAADRMLTAGNTSFTYDANGNQISKIEAGGGTTVYSYDAANRLTSVFGPAAMGVFAYDGDGNRLRQTVGTGTYNYVNDVATALPVVLQESGPDGNVSYAYGLGLISESSSAFNYFYHYDGLGSVVGLSDSNGKLAGRYVYDAWGNADLTVPAPQLGTANKFRFTGEALDPGTGLYYLRARYYDPFFGRFTELDPNLGSPYCPQTLYGFSYGVNNPIVKRDPSGRSAFPSLPNTDSTLALLPPSSMTLPTSAAIMTAPSRQPITISDIKQWTEANRTRIFFGAGAGVTFVKFLAALLKGEIPIAPTVQAPASAPDPARNESLKNLSYKCFPFYELSGFSYTNPSCGP